MRPGSGVADFKTPVWSCGVVVSRVGAEDALEMPAAKHKHPVQALCPDTAHPTFREGVRARRPDRRLDDPHPLGAKHLIEGAGKLAVAVVDQKPDAMEPLPKRQVAG